MSGDSKIMIRRFNDLQVGIEHRFDCNVTLVRLKGVCIRRATRADLYFVLKQIFDKSPLNFEMRYFPTKKKIILVLKVNKTVVIYSYSVKIKIELK